MQPALILDGFLFFYANGLIDYHHGHMLQEASEPWEDGKTYVRIGKRSKITQIETKTEILLPETRQSLMQLYKEKVSRFVNISIKEGLGGEYVTYYDVLVHDVEDITDMRDGWAGVVNAGGLIPSNGYKYYLTCLWTVEKPKPFSARVAAQV